MACILAEKDFGPQTYWQGIETNEESFEYNGCEWHARMCLCALPSMFRGAHIADHYDGYCVFASTCAMVLSIQKTNVYGGI